MFHMIRVNMSQMSIRRETIPEHLQHSWGRAFTSRVIAEEVPPTCAPLGPHNKLVIAVGPLAGRTVSSAGRLSVGGKSPLTGGIKESNVGGTVAGCLARWEVRGLIIEGCPAENRVFVLRIGERAELIACADRVVVSDNYACANWLMERFGRNAGFLLAGPAAFMGLSSAGIAAPDLAGEPCRFAARGGLGSVMASKGIKAIVVDPHGPALPEPVDRKRFASAVAKWHEALLAHHTTGQGMPTYGTAEMVVTANRLGALPTRNFRQGAFERASDISGIALRDLVLRRGGRGRVGVRCMPACVVRCSNRFPDENGQVIVSSLDYETIALLGSNLGIGSLDDIATFNRLCNGYGIDTIETGACLGMLLEAGYGTFGDARAIGSLLHEIGKGTLFGRLIGSGAQTVARVLGTRRVPAARGQAFPGYDPRAIKGLGVTYATSPMGADHTAGNTAVIPGVNHHAAEGQVAVSARTQLLRAVYDSLGLCNFTMGATMGALDTVVDMISGCLGAVCDTRSILENARHTLNTERRFNAEAGLGQPYDRLPEWVYEEPLPPHGLVFDISPEEIKDIKW